MSYSSSQFKFRKVNTLYRFHLEIGIVLASELHDWSYLTLQLNLSILLLLKIRVVPLNQTYTLVCFYLRNFSFHSLPVHQLINIVINSNILAGIYQLKLNLKNTIKLLSDPLNLSSIICWLVRGLQQRHQQYYIFIISILCGLLLSVLMSPRALPNYKKAHKVIGTFYRYIKIIKKLNVK